jgi:hypothetical protein
MTIDTEGSAADLFSAVGEDLDTKVRRIAKVLLSKRS